jgi:hypothetical protein
MRLRTKKTLHAESFGDQLLTFGWRAVRPEQLGQTENTQTVSRISPSERASRHLLN